MAIMQNPEIKSHSKMNDHTIFRHGWCHSKPVSFNFLQVKCNLAESKSSGEDLSYKDKGKSGKEGNKLIKDKKFQSRKDNSKTDRHSRARKEHSPGPSEGAALLLHGDAGRKSRHCLH